MIPGAARADHPAAGAYFSIRGGLARWMRWCRRPPCREKITGHSMDEVMKEYIFTPMGLTNTAGPLTAGIPAPVVRMNSSERRAALQIPDGVQFYEDATFWNPSWTTASGAVQTTDIFDLGRTAEIVCSGELLSDEMYQQQVRNNLAGTGGPTEACPKV